MSFDFRAGRLQDSTKRSAAIIFVSREAGYTGAGALSGALPTLSSLGFQDIYVLHNTDQTTMLDPDRNIVSAPNSYSNLCNAARDLSTKLDPVSDLLLLYIAGHGIEKHGRSSVPDRYGWFSGSQLSKSFEGPIKKLDIVLLHPQCYAEEFVEEALVGQENATVLTISGDGSGGTKDLAWSPKNYSNGFEDLFWKALLRSEGDLFASVRHAAENDPSKPINHPQLLRVREKEIVDIWEY